MDKNRSEVFGQFSYDESLTYEELLDVESTLIADLEALLMRAGATHLDFTPLGDALMCQCAFEAHKLYVYRKIAQEAAALLPRGVTGRLLCLDKSLAALQQKAAHRQAYAIRNLGLEDQWVGPLEDAPTGNPSYFTTVILKGEKK